MKTSWLYRSFFVALSCFMAIAYQYSTAESDPLVISVMVGIGKGLVLFMLFFAAEIAMRRMTLRLLNTIILGLFTGALLGYAITTIVTNAYALLSFEPSVGIHHFLLMTIYLGSIYLSMMLIASAQENFWLSIPFIKFTPGAMAKKRDIVVDLAAVF